MTGQWDLPRGDRDMEDTRHERPIRDLTPQPVIPPKAKGEGFTAYLDRLSKDPSVVPVYTCAGCGIEFNHEPTVPEDEHVEEAKRKGRTWHSRQCLADTEEKQGVARYEEALNR